MVMGDCANEAPGEGCVIQKLAPADPCKELAGTGDEERGAGAFRPAPPPKKTHNEPEKYGRINEKSQKRT